MRISVFTETASTENETSLLVDFVAVGLGRSGDTVSICHEGYESCDIAVILWSPKVGSQPRMRAARKIRNLHSQNLLIIEQPLLRQSTDYYYRVGFDHVHRAGRFAHIERPSDRVKLLGVNLQQWKSDAGPIIVAGQLPGDYSLDGVDILEWAHDVTNYLERYSAREIILRPHPRDVTQKWKDLAETTGYELSTRSLGEDLARAGVWVSLTSGSAIDAIIAGVKSVCLSPNNFGWPVSLHSVDEIETAFTPDRTAWVNQLTYSQWTREEIADGKAWESVRACYLPQT